MSPSANPAQKHTLGALPSAPQFPLLSNELRVPRLFHCGWRWFDSPSPAQSLLAVLLLPFLCSSASDLHSASLSFFLSFFLMVVREVRGGSSPSFQCLTWKINADLVFPRVLHRFRNCLEVQCHIFGDLWTQCPRS